MQPEEMIPGTRVKTNVEFSGLPEGSLGTITEDYGTGVMVKWDERDFSDGFDKKRESQYLNLVKSPDGICFDCGGMRRVPYGLGISDGEEYDLCPQCNPIYSALRNDYELPELMNFQTGLYAASARLVERRTEPIKDIMGPGLFITCLGEIPGEATLNLHFQILTNPRLEN